MLQLQPGIWTASLAAFWRCGRGRNECVAYWTAQQKSVDEIDQVEHPDHSSTPFHYAPDQQWLTTFFARLVSDGRTVRAQVHTHRFRACHSETDDLFPLVHVPGFLSIVVPSFAAASTDVRELFAAEITADGHWTEVAIEDRVGGLR